MNKPILLSLLALLSLTSIILIYKKRVPRSPDTIETLIVGTNAEFQPFSFMKNGEIVGFDIDVAKEISQRLGKKMNIKNMSFDALIPEIQFGSIHMIAASMTPTPERAKRVFFTKPHLIGDKLVIVSPKDTPLKSIDELKGKIVVVNEGYTSDMYLSPIENINLLRISSAQISDGLLALQSKQADAFVAAYHSLKPFFEKQITAQFMFSPIPQAQESDALAVSKKYPELFKQVQEILEEMEQDGTLQKLKEKWDLA